MRRGLRRVERRCGGRAAGVRIAQREQRGRVEAERRGDRGEAREDSVLQLELPNVGG